MKIYRDPETGRFISKIKWEEIQREKEREEDAVQYNDYDDFEDFGDGPEEDFSPQGGE